MNGIKLAARIVTTIGVGKVVGDIVKNNTTVTNTAQKIMVEAGSWILGAMVVDHATWYVYKAIDEIAANVTVNIKKLDDGTDDSAGNNGTDIIQ